MFFKSALLLMFAGTMLSGTIGCAAPVGDLTVNVVTGLHGGREFSSFRVTVSTLNDVDLVPAMEAQAPVDQDLSLGVPAAFFEGLAWGSVIVRVELLDEGHATVAQSRALVEIVDNSAVTLVIGASCLGVTCEDSGLSACLGGRCVTPACAAGVTEACGRDLPSLAELTGGLMDNICRAQARCFSGSIKILSDFEACSANVRGIAASAILPAWQASISEGTLIYRPEHGPACLDTALNTCADITFSKDHAECARALQGTVELGGSCRTSFDCLGVDTSCDFGLGCPGRCVSRLGPGAPCDAADTCQTGLICFAGACTIPVATGMPCAQGRECQVGSACIAEVCVALDTLLTEPAGAACDETSLCEPGLSCTLIGGLPRCGSAEPDGPCHFGVPDPCPSHYYCDAPANLVDEGICQHLPLVGQTCLPSDPTLPECDLDLLCGNDGFCHRQGHLGQACAANIDCHSGHCIGGVCQQTCADLGIAR